MKFIVYRNSDGMIMRTGECSDSDASLQASVNETVIEGEADDEEEYILAGVVTLRPELTAAWDKTSVVASGIDTATLGSSLPNPTQVAVTVPEGASIPEAEEVTEGIFIFATPIAGTYTVTVLPPFPYQPHTQVITAI